MRALEKLLVFGLPVVLALFVLVGMLAPRFVHRLRRIQPTTILLYNHITPTFPAGEPIDQKYYYVSTKNFDQQLKLLKDRGFTFLTLDQYRKVRQNPKAGPSLPLLITFRDANSDIFTNAAPILQKYHAPAIVFYQYTSFGKPGFFTQQQVQQAASRGLTVLPADYNFLNDLSARQEVSGTVPINQFEDLLPPETYDSAFWIILFTIFTFALTVFTLVRPQDALLVPILLLPTYLMRFTLFGVPFTLLELALVVVIVAVLAKHFSGIIKDAKSFPYWPQTLIFLFAAVLSTYFAADKVAALGGLKAYILEPIAFGYILYYFGRQYNLVKKVFASFIVTTGIVGVIAYINYLQGYVNVNIQKSALATFFGNPNYLATFLSAGLLLCAYFLLFEKDKSTRIFSIVGLVALLPAFYFAKSSSAVFGVAAGLGLLLLLRFRQQFELPKWLPALYATAAILAFFALFLVVANPKVGQKLAKIGALTLESRTFIYETSAIIIRKHPITGVGLENYDAAYVANVPTDSTEQNVALAHNTLLDFWTQMGIFGIFAFAWLLVHFFRNGFELQEKPEMAALMAMMLAIAVHGMLDSQYHKNDYSVIFWTIVGLSAAFTFINSATQALPEQTIRPTTKKSAAAKPKPQPKKSK